MTSKKTKVEAPESKMSGEEVNELNVELFGAPVPTIHAEADTAERKIFEILEKLRENNKDMLNELQIRDCEYFSAGYMRDSVERQKAMRTFINSNARSLNEAARMLAVARTQIELGFLALERAFEHEFDYTFSCEDFDVEPKNGDA
jgi:hypothetical protein